MTDNKDLIIESKDKTEIVTTYDLIMIDIAEEEKT